MLGESKGTAAECEVQEPLAGMPATACNSNPAMVATSVGLETFGSSSIHFGRHGAPNRRDKLEKGTASPSEGDFLSQYGYGRCVLNIRYYLSNC